MPHLEPAFLQSDRWKKLTPEGKAALAGMLQFAIFRQIEWTVDGSAAQVAEWLGSESGLGKKAIQQGLLELELAGLVKKGRSGAQGGGHVIMAPVVGR